MRSSTAAAALAAGLLPTAVMGAAAWLDVCSVDDVLEYFTCQKPVPAGCVDGLAEQAMAWCSNYLSIKPVTVYVSTETPVFTETVTQTTTSMTTTTVVILTPIETTSIATATIVEEETVTETVTAGGSVYKRTRIASTPIASAAPSCVDLTKKNLLHHPAWKLSRACSCLNPQPTTITIGGGNGQGNVVDTDAGVTSAEECCELCFAKPNCIASAFPGSCQYLVKVTQLAGAATNDQCPLGVETYGGLGEQSPSGAIMLGPCHV